MGDNVTGADAGQVTVIRGADLAGATGPAGSTLAKDGWMVWQQIQGSAHPVHAWGGAEAQAEMVSMVGEKVVAAMEAATREAAAEVARRLG